MWRMAVGAEAPAVRFQERGVFERVRLGAEAQVQRAFERTAVAWAASCRLEAVVLACRLCSLPQSWVSSLRVRRVWGSAGVYRLELAAQEVLLAVLVLPLVAVSALSPSMSLGPTGTAHCPGLRPS